MSDGSEYYLPTADFRSMTTKQLKIELAEHRLAVRRPGIRPKEVLRATRDAIKAELDRREELSG